MPRPHRGSLALVVADPAGRIVDLPEFAALGRAGDALVALDRDDCIPLPAGSELFLLPGREPLGGDARTGELCAVAGVTAVAAFLAPAHTQLLTPAYRATEGAPRLPLFAYTAVGWHRGRYYVPAVRVDADRRQDIGEFDQREIARRARALKTRHRANRLWQHLLGCALCSGCPAARNLVMGRWEAPLPTSPACNARCLGCLSLQPADSCCPATQERIAFSPTVAEILEVAVPHLESAPRAVASFGQGCEGEPLLVAPLIEAAVRAIRARTARGTLNLNTNASRPAALGRILDAGLDSVRVSLNSARPELYRAYARPQGYGFEDVRREHARGPAAREVPLDQLLRLPRRDGRPGRVGGVPQPAARGAPRPDPVAQPQPRPGVVLADGAAVQRAARRSASRRSSRGCAANSRRSASGTSTRPCAGR